MRWWRRRDPEAPTPPLEQLQERLSAYLDGELTAAERSAVEAELAASEAARELRDGLYRVREALAGLETVRAPRSFALLAAPSVTARPALRRRLAWATRAATGVAGVAFLFALAQGGSGSATPVVTHPVARSAAAVVPAPTAAAKSPVVASATPALTTEATGTKPETTATADRSEVVVSAAVTEPATSDETATSAAVATSETEPSSGAVLAPEPGETPPATAALAAAPEPATPPTRAAVAREASATSTVAAPTAAVAEVVPEASAFSASAIDTTVASTEEAGAAPGVGRRFNGVAGGLGVVTALLGLVSLLQLAGTPGDDREAR